MAKAAKATLGVEKLDAIADRGYFSGEEILACDNAGNMAATRDAAARAMDRANIAASVDRDIDSLRNMPQLYPDRGRNSSQYSCRNGGGIAHP